MIYLYLLHVLYVYCVRLENWGDTEKSKEGQKSSITRHSEMIIVSILVFPPVLWACEWIDDCACIYVCVIFSSKRISEPAF